MSKIERNDYLEACKLVTRWGERIQIAEATINTWRDAEKKHEGQIGKNELVAIEVLESGDYEVFLKLAKGGTEQSNGKEEKAPEKKVS